MAPFLMRKGAYESLLLQHEGHAASGGSLTRLR